ncbi:hypothetical protein [Variovorax sp. GB1P17]|uniref:hypothetical protein n=1 Tax=Variovorax sp. GB1P17 TaxID=3443740 RepID=UPI003F45CD5A
MYILKDGRAAFLEFLRNLSPQVLLLTIAAISSHRLTFTCCYVSNIKATLLAICFYAVWGAAVWANATMFIKNSLVPAKKFDDESRLLAYAGVRGWRNMRTVLAFAWRSDPWVFVEILSIAVVVEVAMVVVMLMAIGSANSFLKMIQP